MNIKDFIRESNRIEGIHCEPTLKEIAEFERFIGLDTVTIKDLKQFVSVYAPGQRFRGAKGLNVSIGGELAPLGGQFMYYKTQEILDNLEQEGAYKTHVAYELLHPFTDGNGRSGRALWAWQMNRAKDGWSRSAWLSLGFLHTFYYQTLQNARR